MTINEIRDETCKVWGITQEQFHKKSCNVETVTPRRAAMIICVEVFEYPMKTVDRALGFSSGRTRHFVKESRKEFSLTDRSKYAQLRMLCLQRKNNMCKEMAINEAKFS